MDSTHNYDRKLAFGLLIGLSLVWGSSFILMKIGLVNPITGEAAFSARQLGALRMIFAALTLLPIFFKKIKLIPKKSWLPLIVVAICGNGLPAFLYAYAEEHVSSSFAGMITALTPLFTTLIAVLVFKSSLTKKQIIGLIIGYLGACLLAIGGAGDILKGEFHLWPVLAIVLATFCYGISSNTIKNKISDLSPLTIASAAFTVQLIPMLCIVWPTNVVEVAAHNMIPLAAIAVLGIGGTALALIMFNRLVAETSAVFASTVTYVIPVIAAAWGIVYGEGITLLQFLGMVVILGGVYLVNKKKKVKKTVLKEKMVREY